MSDIANQDKRLFLLDAYALIYRSYFAFIRNPRFNSKGLNTSAMLGFTNTLEMLLSKEKPTHVAVVFDVHAPTFRHEMYEPYKAQREEMPEDLRKAIPWVRKIIEAYNIPIIEKAGFEADDVIGTLAKKAEQEGYTTYMMTPDKDYAQFVITSYSIHYTKLYDFFLPEQFTAEQLAELKEKLKGYNLVVAGLHLYESKRRHSMQVGNMQKVKPHRITSYNVCYTKLLRVSTTSAGYSMQYEKYQILSLSAENLIPAVESSNAGTVTGRNDYMAEKSIRGYYLQQTFGYKDKLFLTGAVRVA